MSRRRDCTQATYEQALIDFEPIGSMLYGMAMASTARSTSTAARTAGSAYSFTGAIDRCVEAILLTAIVLVPLIVLPEDVFFSITSMPKIVVLRILASLVVVLMCARMGHQLLSGRLAFAQAGVWARSSFRSPSGRLAWAAVAVLVATAISTAVSISPKASLWGRDPSGQGDGLYTTAAYLVMFGAIAWSTRSRGQVRRLWMTVAVTGLLAAAIGVAQSFGLSPLGISGTNWVRVTGPSGNPIFFGSLLVITAPVGAGLLLSEIRDGRLSNRWLLATAAIGAAIYMLALLSTVSKGPWLAAAAAGVTFLALTVFVTGRRTTVQFSAAAGVGVLVATAVFFLPSIVKDQSNGGPQDGFSDGVAPSGSAESIQNPSDAVGGRVADTGNSISERLVKLRTSLGLGLDRPEVPGSASMPIVARHLAGYGPDTFRYVYPLRADESQLAWRTSAAHNDIVNRFVEQGWMGTAAWAALWATSGLLAIRLVRMGRRTSPLVALLAAGVFAAMAGRFIEQLFGIPQAGDTLIFWVLLGLLIAGSRSMAQPAEQRPQSTVRPVAARDAVPGGLNLLVAAPMTLLGLVAVAALFGAWDRNVDYWRADVLAGTVARGMASGPAEAITLMETAVSLAPDVAEYRHYLSAAHQGAASQTLDPRRSFDHLSSAYESEAGALVRYPFDREMYFRTAYLSWELAKAGVPGKAEETLRLYERLTELSPNDPVVWERLEAIRSQVIN